MSTTFAHIECPRAPTVLIVEATTESGFVTYVLDPEHFTQIAADLIGEILNTLVTDGSWRYHGQDRKCATEFEVMRNHDRPSGAAVVCCNDPGWTAISVDADQMTEAGRAALQDAIVTQMSQWEQVSTAV